MFSLQNVHCNLWPSSSWKETGCGGERTSLNYIFRGLLNIPNQRYETHLAT